MLLKFTSSFNLNKVLRKHNLQGGKAASVLLKLFMNVIKNATITQNIKNYCVTRVNGDGQYRHVQFCGGVSHGRAISQVRGVLQGLELRLYWVAVVCGVWHERDVGILASRGFTCIVEINMLCVSTLRQTLQVHVARDTFKF